MSQDNSAGGAGQAGEHGRGSAIHYQVDTEPQVTDSSELTPTQIMSKAGIAAANHYLILLGPHGQTSYKDRPDVEIEMKNGMHFMSEYVGPTRVS
jgi:hypothetical protein